MDTTQENIELDKLRSEIDKIRAETVRLNSEVRKIDSETAKINRETVWYPMVVVGTIFAAATAFVAAIVKIFG